MLHGVSQLPSSTAINSYACMNWSQYTSLLQHVSHIAGIKVERFYILKDNSCTHVYGQ